MIRKSEDRGRTELDWLDSRHSFSFGEYHDPKHMGFGVLRVINEDRVAGGGGFSNHGHRDMEIISYVASGSLEHQDSMGHKIVILPGEVQKMSAGTGVRHSEYNRLKDRETHFFQIWIEPDRKGHPPSYGQKSFSSDLRKSGLVLAASSDGREGSLSIHQDADVYVGKLKAGAEISHRTSPERKIWIQLMTGGAVAQGVDLRAGDGLGLSDVAEVKIRSTEESEFFLFDLPD